MSVNQNVSLFIAS